MANLSVLFGQVSGSRGTGVDIRPGLESRQQCPPCAAEGGVRRKGHPKPLPRLRAGVREMVQCCRPFPHRRLYPPQVVRGLSAGARVFEYMTLRPCIPLSGGCRVPQEHLRGAIAFHDVCFRSALAVGAVVFPRGRAPLEVQ